MKKRLNNNLRWLIVVVILCWGFGAFILLAGEEIPESPMGPKLFVILKIAAIASLIICAYLGKLLYNAGLLPDEFEHY